VGKTIQQINEKIKEGRAVVFNAEEIIEVVQQKGAKAALAQVDVVTTGTFAPMCSSGAYFNIGHTTPRIKLGGGSVTLNDVPAYTGFAAVDLFLGATAMPDGDPRNRVPPGRFAYGGGHVIEDLAGGKDVLLVGRAYGTDCYPRRKLETWIRLEDMNEAMLFNMRNAYQNYNVAVNLSDRVIYTYMGVLQPRMRNATYCSAGQLSPLLNDPLYRTIGIGTRIFLGGERGIPRMGAGTLAVLGDLKQMSSRWLRGASFTGYGVTLAVGIGIPIPVLDEEILEYVIVRDRDIKAQVVDYSDAYPNCTGESLGEVTYEELKSGSIAINGKRVPASGLSSYVRAREIADILKDWIKKGAFELTEPTQYLPSVDSGAQFKALKERPINNETWLP
jgi:L-aspartate semialdehyde sulfurtransferase